MWNTYKGVVCTWSLWCCGQMWGDEIRIGRASGNIIVEVYGSAFAYVEGNTEGVTSVSWSDFEMNTFGKTIKQGYGSCCHNLPRLWSKACCTAWAFTVGGAFPPQGFLG